MKKIVLMTGLALIMLASCKKKEDQIPATPPPVEDPAPPPTPEPQTQTTTTTTTQQVEEDKDGTSITLDSDGMTVESKDGDKENNVQISTKKNTSSVKIETD